MHLWWPIIYAATQCCGRAQKWEALGNFIAQEFKGNLWSDNMVSYTRQATKSRTLRRSKQDFYRGQLWQIHGKAEAGEIQRQHFHKLFLGSSGETSSYFEYRIVTSYSSTGPSERRK